MKGSIAWFTRNTVAANVLMLLILAGGFVTLRSIKVEVFPEFSLDLITVQVEYLGAAPEEVEEAVCVRVEEAIQGIDGVKKITSQAMEGFATVSIQLELGADSSRVLDDVKSRVDAIDTFPAETEKPVIREVTNRRQVIDVSVWGEADETTLKALAEQVRDEITAIDGITIVELPNARPYEISIEVSETALRRYGLTFDQVASAVRRSSIDLPGGSIKTRGGEILLRAKGQAERQRQFEELVLVSRPDGTHLTLGEVATVIDGFADTDQESRFNGAPTVLVEVFRTGDQSALDVANKVKAYVAEAQPRMPEGIVLTHWQDASKVLKDRISVLARNGIAGLILVFCTLALFLRFRLAAWVSLGIVISFAGAVWLMPTLDVTINLISLFAFILVLGIVVDDAIVAGENVFTHQHRHHDGVRGSIEGAQEISVPVVFAVLTTIAAFFPLLTVAGTIGKVMRVIPLIVVPCLLFSLVESLWILPAHLSHMSKKDADKREGMWRRFQGRFTDFMAWFIKRVYRPSLDFGLKYRYLTLAVGIATLLFAVGLFAGGRVKFTFFPDVEADYISVAVTMPQGTPQEVTSQALEGIEAAVEDLRGQVIDEIGEDPFRYVITSIGSHPYRRAQDMNAGRAASGQSSGHLGEVTIELVPAENRTSSSTDLAARWREITGQIPDAVEVAFSASLFKAGEAINVQFTGPDIETLRNAANDLKARIAEYPGAYQLADSFREGKRELKLNIKPQAEMLGLTLADLARQVRQAFYGEEAQRIVRGREDIRVMVRYPDGERRSIGDLENMRVRTPDGTEVAFGEVATVESGRGFSSIQRVDRRRTVNVTGEVDESKGQTASEINDDLEAHVLPELLTRYPGVMYTFEGANAEQRDTLGGLKTGFMVALLFIYVLLAVPLRSYFQPLLIMSAIPFGLVGAVFGHIFMGLNLTILSLFGVVALAGVVVNDSLVMVDFINRNRATMPAGEAVRQAGPTRFRPILLTSLTTFVGLLPLILEKSMQAQFLIPMAVSLAFGVMFSTFITLMLVPAGYLILNDIETGVRRILGRPEPVFESRESAQEKHAACYHPRTLTEPSARTPTLHPPTRRTGFFGHPPGLAVLFFTEMWERFGFYGMRALLILYLTASVTDGGLAFDAAKAGAVYALFTSMVYLLGLPGGWLADRVFGLRRAVLIGGVLIALGYYALALPSIVAFYGGLGLIIAGTGLLKPNISAIVGQLYPRDDDRRDAGFSLFYMGINFGAFGGPLICSWLGEKIDWHLGFGAAGVGMTLGLIIYLSFGHLLGDAGKRPAAPESPEAAAAQSRQLKLALWIAGGAIVLAVAAFGTGLVSLDPESLSNAFGIFLLVLVLVFFGWLFTTGDWTAVERGRLWAIVALFVAASFFWGAYEQAGSSLNLFARNDTDRMFGSWEFPAGWFQFVPAAFVILQAPLFAWLWIRMGKRQPSSPAKFSLGLIFVGLGFVVMVVASTLAAGGQKVGIGWLMSTYFLHVIGEMCLSPVGLSTVTKLAPERVTGLMMGVWFLASAVGNYLGGRVAGMYETLSLPALFGIVAGTTIVAGVVLALLTPAIRRLMGGVH